MITTEERYDEETVRLTQALPLDVVSAVVRRVSDGVERELGASSQETRARADAMRRALQSVADGVSVGAACATAVRLACTDARRMAVVTDCASLDAPITGDGSTLADMLAASEAGTARLSAYDDQSGPYRGTARPIVGTDVLRPLIPAPEEILAMVRERLTDDARAILDATLAVNAASLGSLQKKAEAIREAMGTTEPTKEQKQAYRNARRNVQRWTPAPRTADVARALGRPARGGAATRLAAEQARAMAEVQTMARAYVTHALAVAQERADAQAERQSRISRRRGADPLATPWLARLTTRDVILAARAAMTPRVTDPTIHAWPEEPTHPGRVHGPWEWTAGYPLPGPSRIAGSRMPKPTETRSDPIKPRGMTPEEADALGLGTVTTPAGPWHGPKPDGGWQAIASAMLAGCQERAHTHG